jgi:hypothetical protein
MALIMNNWILPETAAQIASQKAQGQQRIQEQQINELFAKELAPRYALIDAALWQNDMSVLRLQEFTYCSLFKGSAKEQLATVAPYLVDLESADKESINEIVKENPIERRILRLHSELDLGNLHKHLRHFLRMKTEAGLSIYSRFYDPYVASCLFEIFTTTQLEEFFAPITYFIVEDVRINERQIFYLSAKKELQIKCEVINNVDSK